MNQNNLPLSALIGIEPDEATRAAWSQSLARLDEQLTPLVSGSPLPRAEYERLSGLSAAVKAARTVLVDLSSPTVSR